MADDERQATPCMSCFDLSGVCSDDQGQLLAGIKGNEKAGGDKNYKKVVSGHGAQILSTAYALSFETALRATALLKIAEYQMERQDFIDLLMRLAGDGDVVALAKMVEEKRSDFSGQSLVNPAVAGDVAVTGEALPGRWAALSDKTGALKAKREELLAQQKKQAAWAKQEKKFAELKAAGLMTDEEIEAKKADFMAKDPANDNFTGDLEDTGEEAEKTGVEKVKTATTDAVAEGAANAVTKGFGALLGGS
jgi:hypothetical protein